MSNMEVFTNYVDMSGRRKDYYLRCPYPDAEPNCVVRGAGNVFY
jgi:hypothetical protein